MTENSFQKTVKAVNKFIRLMKTIGVVITSGFLVPCLLNFVMHGVRDFPFKMK